MNREEPVSRLRLSQIDVTKLFGVFNHAIVLNEAARITIIHGPNGFGKTALLRLTAGFFERHYSMLGSVPFEKMNFRVGDQSETTVTRHESDGNGRRPTLPQLKFFRGDQSWEWKPKAERSSRFPFPMEVVGERIPWLHRVDEETWFDSRTGEQLSLLEVADRYSEHLPPLIRTVEIPDWLRSVQESVQVHFIRANRLESTTAVEAEFRMRRAQFSTRPAVVAYAEDLAGRIQRVLADYAKLSQSLDQSFPVRIMSPGRSPALSLDQVKQRLGELDSLRRELNDAGLLDPSPQEASSQFPTIDDSKLDVLSVYINDVEQKLSVFSDLRSRIELFRELLNRRFFYKQVRIDKTRGLVFQTDVGQELLPTALSTGEQHEVVILYQLLFLTQPNSLILIDEPEISLHVAWQEQFLSDLARITELSQLDFLVATHSPAIIGNRWDLTVELKGPKR